MDCFVDVICCNDEVFGNYICNGFYWVVDFNMLCFDVVGGVIVYYFINVEFLFVSLVFCLFFIGL